MADISAWAKEWVTKVDHRNQMVKELWKKEMVQVNQHNNVEINLKQAIVS